MQFAGGPTCPGFGWHGSKPVAIIAAAPSQIKPEQVGPSCQLSFCAITFWPEKIRKNGLAKVLDMLTGAPLIVGPRDRTKTLIEAPSRIKPPIITLSPVRTRPRV